MTEPACPTCGTRTSMLWDGHLAPVGPCRARASGYCYWCSKRAAMRNGGLLVALPPPPTDSLARLLRLWDERDKRDYGHYTHGVRYVVELGGMRQELST